MERQSAREFLKSIAAIALIICVLIVLVTFAELWPIFLGIAIAAIVLLFVGLAIYRGFFEEVTD